MNRALVFSIEEFSVFDGPGIRTTVFLKGCPLKCSWCHNPEGQTFANEIIKSQGCTDCGACLAAGHGKLDAHSISVCPNQLLRFCAEEFSPQDLLKKLEGNFDLLKCTGGGVTFSGGEPLSHPNFLKECLCLLRKKIHTAVQTSGFCTSNVFKEVLALVDYCLFDIKFIDPKLHFRYTGVENTCILENFKTLVQSGTQFMVRTPLIPGVTDTEENLIGIAQLLKEHGVDQIELLPYNRAAGAKYAAVGRKYTPNFDETKSVMPRIELFETYHIRAVTL